MVLNARTHLVLNCQGQKLERGYKLGRVSRIKAADYGVKLIEKEIDNMNFSLDLKLMRKVL